MRSKMQLIIVLLLGITCSQNAASSEDSLDQRERELKKRYDELVAKSAWMDDRVKIFYTRSNLQPGHVIADADLEEQETTKNCAPADTFRTKSSLIGKKLSRKILKGQLLSVRDFGQPLTETMKASMIAHKYPAGKFDYGKIVYALQPIKAGTRFARNQLAEMAYPIRYIPQDQVPAASIVAGRKVRQDVLKFGIITQRDIAIGE